MKITGKAVDNYFHIGDEPRFFYGHRVPRTWIAVFDRKKAHIFYKTADDLELIAEAVPDFEEKGLDISNDDIGRTSAPFNSSQRSGVDPREGQIHHEEVHFARSISRWLENANNHEAFDRLVIVAAPRMLGLVRADLSEHVKSKLANEMAKDVTNMSIPEIKRHLSNIVYFKEKTLQRRGRKIVGS